jgi:hypothetical protein
MMLNFLEVLRGETRQGRIRIEILREAVEV